MLEDNLKWKAKFRKKNRKYFLLTVLDLIGIAVFAWRGVDNAFHLGANGLAEGITDALIEDEKNAKEPRE